MTDLLRIKNELPPSRYRFISGLTIAAYSLLTLMFPVNYWLSKAYGVDFISSLGFYQHLTKNRTAALEYLFLFCLALNFLVFCFSWARGRRQRPRLLAFGKTVVLLSILLLIAQYMNHLTYKSLLASEKIHDMEEQVVELRKQVAATREEEIFISRKFDSIFQLVTVENLPTIEYDTIFNRKHLPRRTDSFPKFHRALMQLYSKHSKAIEKKWQLKDEKKLKALFFMNFVSRLWGFGNPNEENQRRPGCVRINEDTKFKTIPKNKINFSTYLKSHIGCCTDFSDLLQILLTRESIPARHVGTYSHQLVEVDLKDGTYVLDPTSNMMYRGSWEQIHNYDTQLEGKLRVTLFPHIGTIRTKGNPYYRERVGQFRFEFLYLLLTKHYFPAEESNSPRNLFLDKGKLQISQEPTIQLKTFASNSRTY